ncbi:MAG: amidohydrolase family protein [Desulfovibrio sp.]|nr:amidohydrolase family protein [Desulfovibrio sp.]
MAENKKKDKNGLDISRRDFLRLAGTGAVACAATTFPGGTVLAAEEQHKATYDSRNTRKAAGVKKKGKADLLILGNVITMDEYKPFAEAVAVRGDTILYVGEADVARKLCDDHTKIRDYGNHSVYPGFLEAHCHPAGAGNKMVGQARMDPSDSLETCVQIIKKYIEANPQKTFIHGSGFSTSGPAAHASMLDALGSDKSIVVESYDGHTMWLNSKAMKEFGINREAVAKWGTDCVQVDSNGIPTGVISETPTFHVRANMKFSVDDMKKALLAWQDYALSRGYTAAYDAGVEIVSKSVPLAFYALEEEGKLKHYAYAGSLIQDNTDTPEEDMNRVAAEAEKHNSKHYHLIGAKVFCDGVVEAHTAWLLDDYADQPGYRGVARFNDHEKMVRLTKAAEQHNMNVHVHSIGDASTKAWIDAFADAEEETGNFDMRNALAHLHIVRKEDIKRIADYNIMAVAGMMWTEKEPDIFEQEVAYVGKEKAYRAYPIKSIIDNGAVLASHSDYPVSPEFSVPMTICLGVNGYLPSHGKERIRHEDQCLSREDTLKALTINVAYMWHEEKRMGSLETGKLANLTVFDRDFLKDDFKDIENAKCLATFVDGELVYEG